MSSLFLESRISPTCSAQPARPRVEPQASHLLNMWTVLGGRSSAGMSHSLTYSCRRTLLWRHQRIPQTGRSENLRARGGIEMGSSVEGLKLRRMRVRNELSFSRSTEGGAERSEDLEALREELRRLSKQIEEAEH